MPSGTACYGLGDCCLGQLQARYRSTHELPALAPASGNQRAFVVRDNIRHRRDIESAYLTAISEARQSILIANAYFLPGRRFRRALNDAVKRGSAVAFCCRAASNTACCITPHKRFTENCSIPAFAFSNISAASCTPKWPSSTTYGQPSVHRTSTRSVCCWPRKPICWFRTILLPRNYAAVLSRRCRMILRTPPAKLGAITVAFAACTPPELQPDSCSRRIIRLRQQELTPRFILPLRTDPVAPFMLGIVHGHIGSCQNRLDGIALAAPVGYANADGKSNLMLSSANN